VVVTTIFAVAGGIVVVTIFAVAGGIVVVTTIFAVAVCSCGSNRFVAHVININFSPVFRTPTTQRK
jgi:hypothetical protein